MMILGLMTFLAFTGLTLFAAAQLVPTIRRVRRPVVSSLAKPPRVQVILSLKGLDPFLERCVERLASQNYPNYRLTVVVDSIEDPAWEQAQAAVRSYGSGLIDLRVRTHHSQQCTRKLSNLLTAFDALPSAVEIVALCDGDAVVHESWLRELVDGLEDEDVAAVGANRWYSPTTSDLATLSRHSWNALAVPNTHQHAILWAGSLAIRRPIIDEPEFRAAFERGFADDTVMAGYLHATGRTTKLLAGTYVINSESTTLSGYWNFLVRQMLCVRVHHPRWTPIFGHAALLAAAMIGLGLTLVSGGWSPSLLAVSGLALYGVTLLGLITLYDTRLRRTFPERAALQVPADWRKAAMALPALAFTALIYPAATMRAAWTRRHVWRGVEYRLHKGQVTAAIDREQSLQHEARPAQETPGELRDAAA